MATNKDHIYLITPRAAWAAALEKGEYVHESLAKEGFLHCSLLRQVCAVANKHFSGRKDLVLLEIDPMRLRVPLKYEGVSDKYPHIYGALCPLAVTEVHEFKPSPEGEFFLPRLLVRGNHL